MLRALPFLLLLLSPTTAQGAPREIPFQLDNGLRVHLLPAGGATSVAIIVLFDVGGNADPAGKSGMAHYVEHLYVTAATPKTPARHAHELFARYRPPFGSNAQTGDRYTVIATTFPPERLDEELEDAALRMGQLRITQADLDREVPRLVTELENMYGGLPQLGAQNRARSLIFPTPHDGQRGGRPSEFANFTLEELTGFWKKHYKPASARLILAGGFDPEKVRTAIERHFGPLEAGERAVLPPVTGATPKAIERVEVKPRQPGAKAAVAVAYPAPLGDAKLFPAFLVVVHRGWAESQKSLREPGGIQSLYRPVDDPYPFILSTEIQEKETPEAAVKRIDAFLARLLDPKLTNLQAPRMALGNLYGVGPMAAFAPRQNPYLAAFSLGRRQQLQESRLLPDAGKMVASIAEVTSKDLQRLARQTFHPKKRGIAVVTPEKP